MYATVVERISDIDAALWNGLVPSDAPFLSHEFLYALESTGCVSSRTGWVPQHLVITDKPGGKGQLLGASPLYLKSHSYGEYVFDWAWADAYQRAGLEYYPKLISSVPFTPVTGPKLLVNGQTNPQEILEQLMLSAKKLAERLNVSSLHWLFLPETQMEPAEKLGFIRRIGTQFHWENDNFSDFEGYLAKFISRKRKKIKRERRRVTEHNIAFEVLTGDDIRPAHWDTFYRFYSATIRDHGARPYLSGQFFHQIGRTLANKIVLILAKKEDQYVAGALNFRGSETLYGRYWGATHAYYDLHFETCYYQAIEYCIEQGLSRFEAGAQGEHKLNRGLLPVTTYSAHWLSHPAFFDAISDFVEREAASVDRYREILTSHSPMRME